MLKAKRKNLLNGHFHLNFRVWLVVFQQEIVKSEVLNVGHRPLDFECWERLRCPCQLDLESLLVVQIDVAVTQCMYKLSGLNRTFLLLLITIYIKNLKKQVDIA